MLENFRQFEIKRKEKNQVHGGASSGQPGGSVNLRIRGVGSLQNDTPLYIVE